MAKKNAKKRLVIARHIDNGIAVGVAVTIFMVGIKQMWFFYHILSWEFALVPIALIWRAPFLFLLAYFDEENSQYYLEYLHDYLAPARFGEE